MHLYLQGISLVLRDILEALNSLHSQNIFHGCIHLQSVFVEKRSGEYRGVLDFYPFINTVSICLLILIYFTVESIKFFLMVITC